MTTLYCEADNGDDLRKMSFSKDGELKKPLIMLGALVGQYGYPIGHDIFEGNRFEVHTLLPILEQTQKKYGLPKPSVIADTALLSKENLKNLVREQYRFIIGARIKNESENIKSEILEKAHGTKDGDRFSVQASDGLRLIVTYVSIKK